MHHRREMCVSSKLPKANNVLSSKKYPDQYHTELNAGYWFMRLYYLMLFFLNRYSFSVFRVPLQIHPQLLPDPEDHN